MDSEKMLPKFNGLKIFCGGKTDCAMCANIFERKNVLKYKNLWLVPDFGQITENYLLLFSNRCTPSIGYFTQQEFANLQELIHKTKQSLEKKTGRKVIFFEHGALDFKAKKAGCCVAHAHIHAVPVPENINLKSVENELVQHIGKLKKREIQTLLELKQLVAEMTSYLLYISTEGKMTVFCIGDAAIPSQFFRKHISQLPEIYKENVSWLESNGVKGIENLTWDWRFFRPADRYNSTAVYLLNEFKGGLNETGEK